MTERPDETGQRSPLEAARAITEYWSPKVIAELNDYFTARNKVTGTPLSKRSVISPLFQSRARAGEVAGEVGVRILRAGHDRHHRDRASAGRVPGAEGAVGGRRISRLPGDPILVSHACRNAWLAIRWKRDYARFTGTGYRVSVGLLGISGVAVSVLGMVYGAWLLIIFGLLGPFFMLEARKRILNGPESPKWWLKEHYGAMIANGVATHIAFLQIGLLRLIPELGGPPIQNLAWFGPLALSFIAGWWLDRRYMRPRASPAKLAA